MEKHPRTIFKTLSWRILATSTTLILVYFFTKSIELSASIGILEIIVKTTLYYLHERTWNKTDYGRKIKNLSSTKTIKRSDFPLKDLTTDKETSP